MSGTESQLTVEVTPPALAGSSTVEVLLVVELLLGGRRRAGFQVAP
jgi:hypothetical protein